MILDHIKIYYLKTLIFFAELRIFYLKEKNEILRKRVLRKINKWNKYDDY